MPFSIREATTPDVPVVLEGYQWLFEPPGREPESWDLEQAEEALAAAIESDSSVLLVAISSLDASLAGFCSAYMDLRSVRYGDRCWIEDLAVDPAKRSKRLGRELIAEVRAWATSRGATHLKLETGADRADARRFYEELEPDRRSLGFGWNLP